MTRNRQKKRVVSSMQKGLDKATVLRWDTADTRMQMKLELFARNAADLLADFRKDKQALDVSLESLFPRDVSETLARNLKERAGIRTVQDLIVSHLPSLRKGMKNTRACYQDILLAMRPNALDTGRVDESVTRAKH